jgi:DNA-binding MarR family transcriptional regulator
MNQKNDLSFIVSHILELTVLLHVLFRMEKTTAHENKTNVIRYYILKWLIKKSPRNLTEISVSLVIKKNTLSELLDRMVKDGLIQRQFDLGDRRKILLSITDTGRSAVQGFEDVFTKNIERFMEKLAIGERRAFLTAAATMIRISKHVEICHKKESLRQSRRDTGESQ